MSRWRISVVLVMLTLGVRQSARTQTCGFSQLLSRHINQEPAISQTRLAQEKSAYEQWLRHPGISLNRNSCEVFIVPVVVHVIYANAAANISDGQIHSQLRVLNEDYRREDNTPGAGPGADTRIQFCLAGKNPQGDSTSGIVRIHSTLGLHKTIEEDQLKALSSWDDQRYLNIWIVESISLIDPTGQDPPQDILAYASYPTLPNGLPQGVVIDHRYVGTKGTATAPFDGGRTLTHEIGHYLGLFHPFEPEGICSGASIDNCLSNGDKVCDTPSQQNPTYGCPTEAGNSCADRPCDTPDPAFNYLNYTDDACMNAFTHGQAARMHFFLFGARSSLVDPLNLITTGCADTLLLNRPRTAFSQDVFATCLNGKVQFQEMVDGCADGFEWQFPGGVPAASFASAVTVQYAQPGTYPVTLVTHNAAGSDTLTMSTAVNISAAVKAEDLNQGFESPLFPPPGWQVRDENGQGGWSRTETAAIDGQASVLMPHFDSPSCGDWDALISPPIEMSDQPRELRFRYAYQRRNGSPSDVDELRIDVSDTCGAPWLPVFFRTGNALATVGGTLNSMAFVPATEDWEEVVVDLSDFAASTHLQLRFRTLGRNGQHLYLDDIRLVPSTFVSIEDWQATPSVFPNPSSEMITIRQPAWAAREIRVELWDVQGNMVDEEMIRLNDAGEASWRPIAVEGVYVLKIRDQSWIVVRVP